MEELRKEEPLSWRCCSDIILTTKIFWGGDGVNEKGLSRKHVREGMAAALQRLKVDYVDLSPSSSARPIDAHRTVVRAMTDVVRSGQATAWGTSEWLSSSLKRIGLLRQLGLEPLNLNSPSTTCSTASALSKSIIHSFKRLTTWAPPFGVH